MRLLALCRMFAFVSSIAPPSVCSMGEVVRVERGAAGTEGGLPNLPLPNSLSPSSPLPPSLPPPLHPAPPPPILLPPSLHATPPPCCFLLRPGPYTAYPPHTIPPPPPAPRTTHLTPHTPRTARLPRPPAHLHTKMHRTPLPTTLLAPAHSSKPPSKKIIITSRASPPPPNGQRGRPPGTVGGEGGGGLKRGLRRRAKG